MFLIFEVPNIKNNLLFEQIFRCFGYVMLNCLNYLNFCVYNLNCIIISVLVVFVVECYIKYDNNENEILTLLTFALKI